jgi:hypothetical protein
MPKTIFDCTVCDILKNCGENKEIIDNINNVIVNSKTEKDIEGLFDNVDLKDLIVPTFHYIKKHRDNCLKSFKSLEKTENKKETIKNIQYTDYSNSSSGDIQRTLKTKLLNISAKLIDHVEYELMDFSKAKPNIKDTVSTLKTSIDLMNFTIQEDIEDKGKVLRFFLQVVGEESDLYTSNNKVYKRLENDKLEFIGCKNSDGEIVKKENIQGKENVVEIID